MFGIELRIIPRISACIGNRAISISPVTFTPIATQGTDARMTDSGCKQVEFVQVDGEDHGVADYKKRLEWQNTIFAWFAKYLKDEPQWWDVLYPERHL